MVVVTQIWAGDWANTPECYGISLRCTECDNVQPKSGTDSDQSQFMRRRDLRSQCLRKRIVGLAELFKEIHYNVSVRLEMESDSARHILQLRGPGGLKHIEIRCLAIQQWVREKRLSVSRVETKNNTADLFTKHLDGLRTRALAKKLGLRFLDMAGGTYVGIADGGPNGEDQ